MKKMSYSKGLCSFVGSTSLTDKTLMSGLKHSNSVYTDHINQVFCIKIVLRVHRVLNDMA